MMELIRKVMVLLLLVVPLYNCLKCASGDKDGPCKGEEKNGYCIKTCKSECMRRFHFSNTSSSDLIPVTDNLGCWEGGSHPSCTKNTSTFYCESFEYVRNKPELHYYCLCCHDNCNIEPMNKSMVEFYIKENLKNSPPSDKDIEHVESDETEDSEEFNTISVVGGAVALCVIAVICAVLSVRHQRKKRHLLLFGSDRTSVTTPTIFGSSSEKDQLSIENLDFDIPELAEMHARGRFGCVWRAETPNKTSVAVKIFQLMDKESWLNEQEIFNTGRINGHKHILKFLNACTREEGLNKDLWLVTEFHENGSLYDYYKRGQTMNGLTAVNFLKTMANGLAFLHEDSEKKKTKGSKPAIAHRDLKSKNVLVKSDMTACIADFGLAIIFKNETTGESHGQVGTRRYMAPEVLEGAINFQRDAFLRIDIYAFALVSWEVMSRCHELPGGGCADDKYLLPYELEFGEKPDIDLLTTHVVDQKKRPIIKDRWLQTRYFRMVFDTIEDCWDNDAEARLPAGCVQERIEAVLKDAGVEPNSSLIPFETSDIFNEDDQQDPFITEISPELVGVDHSSSDVSMQNIINLQRSSGSVLIGVDDQQSILPIDQQNINPQTIENHPL